MLYVYVGKEDPVWRQAIFLVRLQTFGGSVPKNTNIQILDTR
jgi:hypothetical protein